jgi:hypothetical protein
VTSGFFDELFNLPLDADGFPGLGVGIVVFLVKLYSVDDLTSLELLSDSLDHKLSNRIELLFTLGIVVVVHQLQQLHVFKPATEFTLSQVFSDGTLGRSLKLI